MVAGKGRSLWGNDISDAGFEGGDQIDLSLANNGGVFVDEVAFGFIEPVEDATLREKRCLGGVDIFCGLGVGFEDASAEGDDLAVIVSDRKHDAVSESAVERAAGIRTFVFGRGEAALGYFLGGESSSAQVREESVPGGGCEAELPGFGDGRIQSSRLEVVPGLGGVR